MNTNKLKNKELDEMPWSQQGYQNATMGPTRSAMRELRRRENNEARQARDASTPRAKQEEEL